MEAAAAHADDCGEGLVAALVSRSFPLNSAWRFRSDVVDDAVDAADFIDDAAGDSLEHIVREESPVGGHAIFRVNGTDGAGVGVGALIAHDADAHDGKKNCEALPDAVVEAGGLDFADDDVVGFLKECDALGGDFSEDANGQAGAGEWLAAEDVFGHGHVAANAADFVLEEVAQGLDQLEFHEFGEAAYVVVAFDCLARTFDTGGLDNVGIEGALNQPVDTAGFGSDAVGFVVEDRDEFGADAFALGFGVRDTGELIEEALAGVDGDDVKAEPLQIFLHVSEFVFAQDAIVDEDASQLLSDCLMHQHGSDRRIDTAGEAADDVAGTDFLPDRSDGGFDEMGGSPVAACAADVEDEVFDDLRTEGGVVDLGMELNGPDAAVFIGDGGKSV